MKLKVMSSEHVGGVVCVLGVGEEGGGEVVSCTNRCAGSSILFTIDHFLEQNTRLECSCREMIDPIYAPILAHVIVMLLLYN